jgi:ABC-type Mn2+/Zn2+ transport system permease subunit
MKQKIITFFTGFLIYGLLFGTFMYFTEANKNIKSGLFQGIFFGTSMGLFDTFILPKINAYFANKKSSKKQ